MTHGEFIKLLAIRTGRSEAECKEFARHLIETATDVVASGQKLNLANFAVLTPTQRKATVGRNPQTGEAVHIRSRTVVRFRASKRLREAVDR